MTVSEGEKPRVALLATCLVDLFRPSVGFAAAKLLADAGCDVRVPPDPTSGRVNMRLKRNIGLELSTGAAVCFFDDDDWRSIHSVQAQLDQLEATDADVCTLQVHYLCEIDAASASVRYFHTPDGGEIFSPRLGNPGTLLCVSVEADMPNRSGLNPRSASSSSPRFSPPRA